jgi:L-seryl-tRNA(Ser) seleniumtransferase
LDKKNLLRQLPAVHELVNQCSEIVCPPHLLAETARQVIDRWRAVILEQGIPLPSKAEMGAEVIKLVKAKLRRSLCPVINATGVILHTNLGRAPLSEEALTAVLDVTQGYCNLEFDLNTGSRGERYTHLEELLSYLTGAEAAIVVNNNAAAVFLTLHTLAHGKEVVVARGELVEIGGSFRIPEIMTASGALLREVGTTNKTYPRDYKTAIGPETALLLKVHPSNFRVVGFTEEVSRKELVEIGRNYQIPVVEDLGSGMLIELQQLGVGTEPTVQESLAAGVDIVTFSGDKLLGGPQAGIIVGKASLIDHLKTNPLLRVLRVDKMTIAALEATLRAYLNGSALDTVPVLKMLSQTPGELEHRAASLREMMAISLGDHCSLSLEPGVSRAGGGALPLTEIPTTLVSLRPKKISATVLANRLRQGDPAVVVRIDDDRILIDPRTLTVREEKLLVEALQTVFKNTQQH